MNLPDPRQGPMQHMLTPEGQRAVTNLFFKYQRFGALLEIFSAVLTVAIVLFAWIFVLELEVKSWGLFAIWAAFNGFVYPWLYRKFDREIQDGFVQEVSLAAQKHALRGSGDWRELQTQCKVCGRFAPLQDGECPDCRH